VLPAIITRGGGGSGAVAAAGGQEVAAGIAGGGGGQAEQGREGPLEGRAVVLLPRFGSEAIGPADRPTGGGGGRRPWLEGGAAATGSSQ